MLVAAAAGQPYVGSLVGTGLKVGVVVARFNELVTKPMLEGALEVFGRHGVAQQDIDVRGPRPAPLPRLAVLPPSSLLQPCWHAGCESLPPHNHCSLAAFGTLSKPSGQGASQRLPK